MVKKFRFLSKNNSNLSEGKRTLIFTILFLILALFLEVFVFNFRHWQSLGYEPLEITVATADEGVGRVDDNQFVFTDEDQGLYFSDFDVEVHNIYIDAENITNYTLYDADSDTKKTIEYEEGRMKDVDVELLMTDAGNSYGLTLPTRTIVSNVERTKYISLHLAGNTDYIRMAFPSSSGNQVQLNSVILNAHVPLFFSFWRFLIVFMVLTLCYVLRPHSSVYDIALNLKLPGQKILIAIVIAVQIAFSMGMTTYNTRAVNATSENAETIGLGVQKRYILLADALLQGHVYVDYYPIDDIEEIEELENPYDTVQLTKLTGGWNDYAYYQGKYYVYFGIVPCLIFNIPVKLLTGIDLMSYPCVMALIPPVILAAFALVYELIRRYGRGKTGTFPLVVYLMLSLIFVNSLSLGCIYALPDAYHLPIFTALFFVLLGLTFWVSAVRTDGEGQTLSGWRLFAGSFCMATTGGCRPQFLIAMFLAIPLFWDTVFKERKLLSVKNKKAIRDTLLFVIPIVLIAIGLCWYNYARFGNIFDFGANYNQTNNDMTVRGYEPYRALQGIFYYILQMPNLQEGFPYLTEVTKNATFMGTNIIMDQLGGLIWLQPAVWCLLLIRPLKEKLKEKKVYALVLMLVLFTLIVACVDSMMAGVVNRYHLDFYWMTALASVLVLMFAYKHYAESSHGNTLKICMLAVIFISIIGSVCFALQMGCLEEKQMNPTFYYQIQSLVEFWY